MLKEYKGFSRFLLIEACKWNNVTRVESQLNLASADMNLYFQDRPLFFLTPKTTGKKASQKIVELFFNYIQKNNRTINFLFADSDEEGSKTVNLIQELLERKSPITQLEMALNLVNKEFFNQPIRENDALDFLDNLANEYELNSNQKKENKYFFTFCNTVFSHEFFQNQIVAELFVKALFSSVEVSEAEQLAGLRSIRHYVDAKDALNETLNFEAILTYLLFFSQKPLSNFLSAQTGIWLEEMPYRERIKRLKELWHSNELDVPLTEQLSPTSARVSQTGMYALGKRLKSQEEQDYPAPKKTKGDDDDSTFTKPRSPS